MVLPAEMLLVEHWEVRRIWNEAMHIFDTLTAWGVSDTAYGEVSGWVHTEGCLKQYDESRLDPGQYAVGPQEDGERGFDFLYKDEAQFPG